MTPAPQNLKNHVRYVPLYHFVLVGLVAMNLLHAARTLLPFNQDSLFRFVVAVALILIAVFMRSFPVTVQDRIIRLEEKLRLEKLAPELAVGFDSFSPQQWTALRFASDAELPALARDVLAGKLKKPDEIKQAIRNWRPDHLRV
jgi:hypothetical protein